MQCKYYGNCKHKNESCKSNTALLKCVYGLNECCTEKVWENDALREENKELKRMLEFAVDQLEEFMNSLCESTDRDSVYSPCTYCLNEYCCTDDDYRGVCWMYKSKAMKLIGGEE